MGVIPAQDPGTAKIGKKNRSLVPSVKVKGPHRSVLGKNMMEEGQTRTWAQVAARK